MELCVYRSWSYRNLRRVSLAVLFASLVVVHSPFTIAQELCPVDMASYETAARSGGTLRLVEGEKLSRRPVMLGELLADDIGELGEESRQTSFLVESKVSQIEVFVCAQHLANVELSNPEGQVVTEVEGEVTTQSSRYTRHFLVTDPGSGTWKARVSGRGYYQLSATVQLPEKDSRSFDCEFLTHGSEELFFDLCRGEKRRVKVELRGRFGTARLEFVTPRGTLLAQSTLLDAPPEDGEWTLTKRRILREIPKQPFRVRISGLDGHGVAFQRLDRRVHRPVHPASNNAEEAPSNEEMFGTLPQEKRRDFLDSLVREELLALGREGLTNRNHDLMGSAVEALIDSLKHQDVVELFADVIVAGYPLFLGPHQDDARMLEFLQVLRLLVKRYDQSSAEHKKNIRVMFRLDADEYSKERALEAIAEWEKTLRR